jgi:putative DNA primase/helicase
LKREEASDAFVHKLTGACRCGESHDAGGTIVNFPAHETKRAPRPKIVKTYDYCDEGGNLLFQAVRYRPKDFKQRRPNGRGGWEWNLQGVRRVPYRLPELLAADAGETVFIFEGEKDADRASEEGLVATTNPQGAGKWRDEYSPHLDGRNVVVVPHNDPEGNKHGEEVARSVYRHAVSVKVMHLPELGDKEDYNDWLDKYRGTPEELIVRAKGTRLWSPPSTNGSVTALPIAPPSRPRNTDLGNAERFVSQHGENVRYCYQWSKWLVWTGSRWTLDDSGMVHRLAKETVKTLYVEAGTAETEEERKALASHARRSESAAAIKAMLELARSDLPISPEDLDSHPYLLNAPNGTVDLRTGEIRGHRREDFLTKITGADYRPDTPAPIWKSFLERVLPSTDLREFVQRSAGYSATGDTSEQCLFINHGGGANGKSTFQEAIADALGDYATRTPTDMLMARRFNGVPNDVARLKGARFVTASETDEGRRLDEARIKDLTGQDTITARFMKGEWFDFPPTHKLHLSTNHKPEIRGTDNAIWRRIRLIPWSVTVPPAEQDKKLPDKLRRELAGILAWMVAGCLQWHREGLQAPEEVRKATGAYRAEMDVLAAFLCEECATVEDESTSATVLFERYKEWCEETGERAEKQRKFGERLKERGYEKQRITSGPDKGKYEYLRIVLLRSSSNGGSGEPSWRKHGIGERSEGIVEPPRGGSGSVSGSTTVHSEPPGEQSFTESFTEGNTSKTQGNEEETPRSSEQSEPKNDLRAMKNTPHETTQKQGSLHSLRSPLPSTSEEEDEFSELQDLFEADERGEE